MALSSTTAREKRNSAKRADEAILANDALFVAGLKIFSGESDSVSGNAGTNAQNSPATPAGNYLAREGDSMIGPLALGPPVDFRIEVDANNTIDISPLNENAHYSSNVELDSIQPNSSVLDIISGAAYDGQLLILRSFAPTVPYTISQGTVPNGGNIQTPDGNDITFGDLQMLVLVFDEALIINANTGGTWRVLGGSGGGSGGQDPIILNEVDLGTIGFINQLIDWSAANFYRAIVNGDTIITMENLPVTGKWEQLIIEITQDGVGGHPVTFSDTFANAVIPNINTGANSKTVIAFYAYNNGSDIILAFDTQSNFNAYPEVDLGTLGPAAVNIDWSLGNFQRMVLSGDVIVTHTNLPLPLQWQQVIVEYTQDNVGNHNTTYTQAFNNGVVPLVNFAPTSKTTVVFYAYNTGTITLVLAFETMSNGNTNFLHATKVANQPPPLTVGTPALFDSVLNNSGLTVAAGIVSGFRAGRIYELECSMAILNAVNAAACLSFQWNDIANATLIGTRGDCILATQLAADSGQPIAKAIFVPTADTDTVEVQFTFNNDLVNTFMYGAGIPGTPASYIMIKDIT